MIDTVRANGDEFSWKSILVKCDAEQIFGLQGIDWGD